MSLADDAAAYDLPDETEAQRTRRRLQAGRCAACGCVMDGRRRTVCVACAVFVGYCPACERVKPLAEMRRPSAARRARGATHGGRCIACHTRERRMPSAPCRRCGASCRVSRRLCERCATGYGYCPRCRRVKALRAFGAPPPKCRGLHAVYCRLCDAARQRERYHRRAA